LHPGRICGNLSLKEGKIMNEASLLKVLTGEFQDKLLRASNLIRRSAKIPEAPGKIKVVIGMRRSGKTYFLYQQILDLIAQNVPQSSILYLNFEDDRLLPLDIEKLARLVDAFYSLFPENHDRKCYLFLDEIQNIENWPIIIRRFHDSKNVEIFLTGSSAKLLSKEIATGLRGRSIATEIWPYSFSEFKYAKQFQLENQLYSQKNRDLLKQIFEQYLSSGGFPEVLNYEPNVRQQTLQDYVDIVIFRDIIERHDIKNPSIVKYMILSMLHNIGTPFSIHKFYNDLKSQGYSIGKDSLYEYLDYIEDAYLSFAIPLYDRSIRKVQANPKKIYAIDPAIARALTLDYENDLGKLFENIIYLELRRLGLKIDYYFTKERYEVDFLTHTAQGKKKLFQVAWDIQDPKTKEREERALFAAMKELNAEGEIITLDSFLEYGLRQ
jgi:predicted AAA+ superfamily ATPase